MFDSEKKTEYYQKTANILRIIRYFVLLSFVVFLLVCIITFGKDFTLDNFHTVLKFASIHNGSSNLYEEPFSINGSDSAQVFMFRDNVAVVDNSNVSLYDLSGTKLYSYDLTFSSPAVVCDDESVLVYDIKGTNAAIFSTLSLVYENDSFKYNIISADICNDGLVFVTSEDSFKSSMFVYDKDYNEIFRFNNATDYITDASFNKKGDKIAVASTSSLDGSFNSFLNIYSVEQKKAVSTVSLSGEIPVKCDFSNKYDCVYALTDSSLRIYDSSLNEKKVIKFNQSKIQDYYCNDEMIIFTESNNLSGNSMTVKGYTFDGKTAFEQSISDEILDIAIGEKHIFMLGINSVYKYQINGNNSISFVKNHSLVEKHSRILCDSSDNCYISDDAVCTKITFE